MGDKYKYTIIDTTVLERNIGIVEKIKPMVLNKTWNVDTLTAAKKICAGTTDTSSNYMFDIIGDMRTTGDALILGNVSMNGSLLSQHSIMHEAFIYLLHIQNLDINIIDLYIHENLLVYNNVSIGGNLYNFSTTFLNYLNVSNETTINNNVSINGSTNLNGINYLNGSTNLNGLIYLNNDLINTNNTIICTDKLTPTYHNYTDRTTLIDIDGIGYIDTLIANNISTTIIKSQEFTSTSNTLGCSITNVLNLSVLNNNNTSAKVEIGTINNPVKMDLAAEQDESGFGLQYKGNVVINKQNTIFDKTQNSVEINGITSKVNINGVIELNTNNDETNNFYLQGTGKIVYDGITYLNSLDIGYNGLTNPEGTNLISQYDTSYKLNVNGSTNISGNLNIQNNLLVGGSITHFSDYKLKTNITKLESSLIKIQNINGYSYNRIDLNDNKTYIGLIAQEVEKEYPDIIEYTNDIRSINYQSFTAILIESIKELNIKVMELEKQLNNK